MSVEDTPEFKKTLYNECEKQHRIFLYGQTKGDTVKGIQLQHKEIDGRVGDTRLHANRIRREIEIMSNPHAREITENLRKLHSAEPDLICPQCGGGNHHNTVNGKPFCMACNLPLMSREKAEKWIKPQPVKRFNRGFNEPDGVMRLKK